MRISRIPAEAGKALEPRRDGKTAHNLQQPRYLAIISRRLAPLNEKWGKSSGARYQATQFASAYHIPLKIVARLAEMRREEMRLMDTYMKTDKCLMKFLCDALESPAGETNCGHCRNCCPETALSTVVDSTLLQSAADFLQKSSILIHPRKQWADPVRAATRFGVNGRNIPPSLQMEEGVALTSYGVGKWGRLVQNGKYSAQPPRFDDQLVDACAELLARRQCSKCPSWIVPVPSCRNNVLVGDFADRLAAKLGCPCWHGLIKVADTPPQKNMENSMFQQNNVIDAFQVNGSPPQGGCILIDDMVDSKWTFTVAAAVLRQVGVEFVIPLALADSSNEGE